MLSSLSSTISTRFGAVCAPLWSCLSNWSAMIAALCGAGCGGEPQPPGCDVEAALGRPVRFANDANCFALSEAADGAAAGCAIVFGVILGTGCGGGIVVGGRVLVGANAIAGEWGHNPLPAPTPEEWPGPPCYCGRTGCIETFLSGPGLAADHRRHGGPAFKGQALDGPAIVAGAAAGD